MAVAVKPDNGIRSRLLDYSALEGNVVLNIGTRFANGRLQSFLRCNPYIESGGEKIVQPGSFIALQSGTTIRKLIGPDPKSGIVGYEDPACDGEYLFCNKVIEAPNPVDKKIGLMSIPCMFDTNHLDAPPAQIGELTGPLLSQHCKGLTLLEKEFCFARPSYSGSKPDSKVMVCRLGSKSNPLDLDPIDVFLTPTVEFPGINISAPLIRIPGGQLLVYHRLKVTIENGEEIKDYRNFANLLDNDGNIIAEGIMPFLTANDLPSPPHDSFVWIKGPVIYFRNLWYSNDCLCGIVTKGDSINYYVEIPLSYVLSTMRPTFKRIV